jgi:hypothetical protein
VALASGVVNGNIVVEGQNVLMANGSPATASMVSLLDPSIINAATPGRFTQVGGVFTLNGATNNASCRVTYVQAAAVGVAPAIVTIANANNGC